jgi:uncharacterized membrane protein
MAQQIVAVAFDKITRADEVLLALVHLTQENAVDLADAAVVSKDDNGRVRLRQTVDISPGRGALSGSWWGLLVGLLVGGPLAPVGMVAGAAGGALYGKLVDTGLNDQWMRDAGETLAPGTSAIFVLINELNLPAVLTELGRYEGKVIYTDFPDETRAALEEALSG